MKPKSFLLHKFLKAVIHFSLRSSCSKPSETNNLLFRPCKRTCSNSPANAYNQAQKHYFSVKYATQH